MFVVPREVSFPLIAYQPGCPIEFVKVANFGMVDAGGGTSAYLLLNRGALPIRSYTIATVSGIGTGQEWTIVDKGPDQWIRPGRTFGADTVSAELVPFTEELRRAKKLPEKMLGVGIFMVERVEFSDGSVFDDEAAYKESVSFFSEHPAIRRN